MLCQNCHQRKANTFISRTVGGHTTELHLCAQCAKELAFDKVSLLGFDLPKARPTRRACPTCGATMDTISATGMLGCPACYTFFEKELTPAITRSHGTAIHTDVTPEPPKKSEREQLEEEMRAAIAKEDFEQAAALRDRIKALKKEEEQ